MGLSDRKTNTLELAVKVININAGKNVTIARKCQTLAQYSAFIATVREYEKDGYTREKAVKKAVIYCREHDILKEFLKQNAHEVMNMLLTEWNWDDALDVRFNEGREEGLEQGIEIGQEKARVEKLEIARNLLAEGSTPEFVQKSSLS